MTPEVYSGSGVELDLLLEPEWSDPPTDTGEDTIGATRQGSKQSPFNAAKCLPIIIHDSDCSVTSESGSSDPDEPISRKARKLAIQRAIRTQPTQPKRTIGDFYLPLSTAAYRSNVEAQTKPDIMDLRSVVAIEASEHLGDDHIAAKSETDDSSSSCSSPAVRKNGYVIDDFVVASSECDSDDDNDYYDDDGNI